MKRFIFVFVFLVIAPILGSAQDNGIGVPEEVKPFIEKDTVPLALEKADLNGDGTSDFVLVLDSKPTGKDDDEGKRVLLILTRGVNGKLTLAKRNDKGVVYCRTCGGAFGDPFASLDVGPKTFTVNMYGGSAWRWSAGYKFNYSRIDKTWQLVRVDEGSFNSLDPEKTQKDKSYLPPRDFGKIDIADFDPDNYLKKGRKK